MDACGTAAEALEKLQTQAFDVVLLDINLDRGSGLELFRKISAEHQNTPAILCTAYGCFKDDFSAWQARSCVAKSSNLEGLKAEVKRILDT